MSLSRRSAFTVSYSRLLGLPLPRFPPSSTKCKTSSRTESGLRRPSQRSRSCRSLTEGWTTQSLSAGCVVGEMKIEVKLKFQHTFCQAKVVINKWNSLIKKNTSDCKFGRNHKIWFFWYIWVYRLRKKPAPNMDRSGGHVLGVMPKGLIYIGNINNI